MVTKLKAKFNPIDYELELFKWLQNLKKKDILVKEYTKELYKLTIWSRHREIPKERWLDILMVYDSIFKMRLVC